jgi:hypothetical protein
MGNWTKNGLIIAVLLFLVFGDHSPAGIATGLIITLIGVPLMEWIRNQK